MIQRSAAKPQPNGVGRLRAQQRGTVDQVRYYPERECGPGLLRPGRPHSGKLRRLRRILRQRGKAATQWSAPVLGRNSVGLLTSFDIIPSASAGRSCCGREGRTPENCAACEGSLCSAAKPQPNGVRLSSGAAAWDRRPGSVLSRARLRAGVAAAGTAALRKMRVACDDFDRY